MIKVIKYPQQLKKEADNCDNLEFVGFSRIDGDPLYKIDKRGIIIDKILDIESSLPIGGMTITWIRI